MDDSNRKPEETEKISSGQDNVPTPSGSLEPPDNNLELPGEQSHSAQPHFKSAKKKRKFPFKKAGIVLVAFATFAGISYMAYSQLSKNDKPTPVANQQQETETTTAPTGDQSSEELTETYTSNTLRLDFKHPEGWTVNEVDRGIRVDSPNFSYTDKDQNQVDGNFRLYFRKGARPVDGQYIGNAYAIDPSQKLTYSSPAAGQRDSTWLTNFWRGSPDNFALFVVQGNYELKKGATLGPTFAQEPDAYLIAGGYSTKDKKDDLDMVVLPASGYDQSQQYKTAAAIVQSLQLR